MKGHIRERSRGSWEVILRFKDAENGRWRQRQWTVRGRKRDAERKRTELLYLYDNRRLPEQASPTVATYLRQWLEEIEDSVSEKTRVGYEYAVRVHIIPALGQFRLADLRPQRIENFYAKLRKSGRKDGKPGGLSAGTVSNVHRAFRTALENALRHQLLTSNPAAIARRPHVERREPQALSQDQLEVLLNEAKGEWIYPLVHVAAFTGMRSGELLAVRWDDIDLKGARLHVRQTVRQLPGRGFVFSGPKTKRSRRTVSLSPSVVETLRAVRIDQAKRRLLLGPAYQREPDLVFATQDGRPLSARTAYRKYQAVVQRAEIPRINFHSLRHTHASLLLLKGAPVAFVSERLGHANPSVTYSVYSHVVDGMQDAYVSKIDEWMTPGQKGA